jgi:hypothetical protein
MGLETGTPRSPDSFWKSVLSDLQETGLLRGHVVPPSDRPGKFDAHVDVALSFPDTLISLEQEAVLKAAWSVVLSRHTSSSDVLFFTSFDNLKPRLAPLRVPLPTQDPVSSWLVEFEKALKEAEAAGPMPDAFKAQVVEEGLDRTLATFLVVPPDAKAFPPRDQIKGPLLVLARLDISMIEIHYDSTWFTATEAQAFGDHLNVVLHGMSATERTVGQLPILTTMERHKLLAMDLPRTQCAG